MPETPKPVFAPVSPRPWKTGSGYEQSRRGTYIYSADHIIVAAAEQDAVGAVLRPEDADAICVAVNTHADLRLFLEWFNEEHEERAGMLLERMGWDGKTAAQAWVRAHAKALLGRV
jgi:hypothetical protein